MAIRPVVKHPNPILRKKTGKVPPELTTSNKMQKLLRDLQETMVARNGIGIAANQIGVDLHVALVNTENEPFVLINSRIIKKSWRKESLEEGCLSVPGVYGNVKRSREIVVETYNKEGEKIKFKAKGLFARVIQHEVDHLNGKLFIDRADKITQGIIPQ